MTAIIVSFQIADNKQQYWKTRIHLTNSNRAIITSHKKLNDNHINVAQKILSLQFPQIKGFQDTLLSQTNMFTPIASQAKCIQVHHVRDNHWITSCSTGDCVEVFDSIYDSLSPDLPVQLAMIYQPMAKDNVLEVKILPSQHQTGSTDCGLFAIAWAAELSSGNRPEDVMLDQTRMRVHFLECLNRGRIDRFPQTHIAKRKWENEPPVIKLKLEEI